MCVCVVCVCVCVWVSVCVCVWSPPLGWEPLRWLRRKRYSWMILDIIYHYYICIMLYIRLYSIRPEQVFLYVYTHTHTHTHTHTQRLERCSFVCHCVFMCLTVFLFSLFSFILCVLLCVPRFDVSRCFLFSLCVCVAVLWYVWLFFHIIKVYVSHY